MKRYYKMFIIGLLTIPNISISQSQNWISSFTKYEQTMSISVPNGYLLKSAPSLESHDVAIKHMDNSLLVVGSVDVDGKRFYMTEWSWSQYLKGKNPNWVLLSESSNQDILNTADAVLAVFKNQDGQALAALAHPTESVRFHVISSGDDNPNLVPIFYRNQIAHLWDDTKAYVWGTIYGDDDTTRIFMPFNEYCKTYILSDSVDVDGESIITVNRYDFPSTLHPELLILFVEDILRTYPNSSWVDYDNMSGGTLRLVFKNMNEHWFLIAVLYLVANPQ